MDTVPRRSMGAILRVDATVLHSDDLANQGHGVSKELNDRVLFCVRAWGIAIERTVATPTSLIVHGKRAGTPVVLKVVKEEGDEWRCGEITAKFGGRGVVQVHEHMAGAALFEKLDPGEPLAALTLAGRDDEATDILAMLLGRMAPGDPPEGCPTVEQWGEGFMRYLGSGDERIPHTLLEPAHRIFRDLCLTQRVPALLHGDLHHYNVLSDRARGWCAIDVKGVVGELEYELGAALRNPIDRPDLFAQPRRRRAPARPLRPRARDRYEPSARLVLRAGRAGSDLVHRGRPRRRRRGGARAGANAARLERAARRFPRLSRDSGSGNTPQASNLCRRATLGTLRVCNTRGRQRTRPSTWEGGFLCRPKTSSDECCGFARA